MTPFKLNGKPLQIADCWQDVTFEQYLKIFDLKDSYAEMISIFAGIEKEVIDKAKIIGLDAIMRALSFLNNPPDFTNHKVDTLCGTKMPKDITFEHLAPFEDMRIKIKQDLQFDREGKIKESAECKATYCAIYLQYMRDKEYDSEKAIALIPEVMKAPAMDVLSLGSFFLIRQLNLRSSTTTSSQTIRQARKKRKPTSSNSTKRSGRTRK